MTSPQVKSPSRRREASAQMVTLARKGHPLFRQLGDDEDRGLQSTILTKQARPGTEGHSKQGVLVGVVDKPFNFAASAEFKVHNPHHSACIDAKKISTVGLGHVEDSTEETLDPLCAVSWQHTLLQLDEDFENTGNAFLEVVRRDGSPNSPIVGLHWMPAVDVWIHVENQRYQMHYEVVERGSAPAPRGVVGRNFAKFGDRESFYERHGVDEDQRDMVSELIHFMEPSALSRFWGVPGWLAAIAYVELVQAMVQHQFDFHINRGVPEFMLFVLGAKLRKADWKKVEDSIQAGIGLGNSHKSLALNISNPEVKIQLEKLALEGTQDGAFFRDMMETLSMSIVSAHRVPPSLAGILIPGKMGASNEASNAIMSFQSLVIGPKQKTFETILGCTLGNSTFNGGLALQRDSFELKTVVDEMAEAMEKLKPVDTMGRMRDQLPEAAAEGRDLEEGVQKADLEVETASRLLAQIFRGRSGS